MNFRPAFRSLPLTQAAAWLAASAALPLLALLLAWIANDFTGTFGSGGYLATLLLGTGFLFGGWRLLRGENPPRWLAWAILGAAVLRLALGAAWLMTLPRLGHGSPAEMQGFVYSDAFKRDAPSWELGSSDRQLERAFTTYRRYDQYGWMLYLNAAYYRYVGWPYHQPLQLAVPAAAFSALVVGFGWAFTRRVWGDKAAAVAAIGLAVYPEATLLGSSQMREAYLIPLSAVSFYGLARLRQERSWRSLAWMLAPLAIGLPLSPPFAAQQFLALAAGVLIAGGLPGAMWRRRRTWLLAGASAVLILAALYFSWLSYAPEGVTNPVDVIAWWVGESVRGQALMTQRASGWLQKVFANTPENLHLVLLGGYGVVQPFLPAALISASESVVWRWIAIWRALGWTLLLPLLLYAPLRAFWPSRAPADFGRRMAQAASLIVWVGVIVAALRAGADQWDNPRYRAVFIALQAGLAAWAILEQARRPDPFLRRVLIGVSWMLVWFIPWYLRRYTPFEWPVTDLFNTLGLGLVCAVLYWLWDWAGATPSSPTPFSQGEKGR